MKENIQIQKKGRSPYARNRADSTHIPYEKIIKPSEQFPSTREYDDPSRKGRIAKSMDSEDEEEEIKKPISRNAYVQLENIADSNDWETFGETDAEPETVDGDRQQIEDKKFLDAYEIYKQKLNDAFYTLIQKYDEYDGWQWDETDTEKALEDVGLEDKDTNRGLKAEIITTQLLSGDFQGMRKSILTEIKKFAQDKTKPLKIIRREIRKEKNKRSFKRKPKSREIERSKIV
jgi:hypothetical protein